VPAEVAEENLPAGGQETEEPVKPEEAAAVEEKAEVKVEEKPKKKTKKVTAAEKK